MARPTRCRRICFEPAYDSFVPEGIPSPNFMAMKLREEGAPVNGSVTYPEEFGM